MGRFTNFFQRFAGAPRDPQLPSTRDPTDDRWFGVTSDLGTYSGFAMSYEMAMQIPAVLACLTVLSEDTAALPVGIFRRKADGSKERLTDYPILQTFARRTNDEQTAFEFRQQMTWDAAFFRNAYAYIDDGERGPYTVLYRLDPQRVTPKRAAGSMRKVFEYRDEQGFTRTYTPDRIMHLRRGPPTADGLRSKTVLETSAHILSSAYAVQDFAAQFFGNYTATGERIIPPVTHRWADEESRRYFLRAYVAATTGRNRHKPRLLEPGFDVKDAAVNNEQSQFIETKRESSYDCARIWRMPPHKIQILDRATNNNIEHQGLEYVVDCLMSYLIMWEQAISRDLIYEEDTVFFEHNVAGLLRGDLTSRYAAYKTGREGGWLCVNEIRAKENMNPIAGGETYLTPLNMAKSDSPGDSRTSTSTRPDSREPEPDGDD